MAGLDRFPGPQHWSHNSGGQGGQEPGQRRAYGDKTQLGEASTSEDKDKETDKYAGLGIGELLLVITS